MDFQFSDLTIINDKKEYLAHRIIFNKIPYFQPLLDSESCFYSKEPIELSIDPVGWNIAYDFIYWTWSNFPQCRDLQLFTKGYTNLELALGAEVLNFLGSTQLQNNLANAIDFTTFDLEDLVHFARFLDLNVVLQGISNRKWEEIVRKEDLYDTLIIYIYENGIVTESQPINSSEELLLAVNKYIQRFFRPNLQIAHRKKDIDILGIFYDFLEESTRKVAMLSTISANDTLSLPLLQKFIRNYPNDITPISLAKANAYHLIPTLLQKRSLPLTEQDIKNYIHSSFPLMNGTEIEPYIGYSYFFHQHPIGNLTITIAQALVIFLSKDLDEITRNEYVNAIHRFLKNVDEETRKPILEKLNLKLNPVPEFVLDL